MHKAVSNLFSILFFLTVFIGCAHSQPAYRYPEHWWSPVPAIGAPSWEILPQEAKEGEVILSKRNELGILSNFAHTPFDYRGKRYESIEGLWQMMLYPEDESDPRAKSGLKWPYSREQVSQMIAFEAKAAGEAASKNMKAMGIDWVSFEGQRFQYKAGRDGRQYQVIREAMLQKLLQNPKVREVLLSTGNLVLKPDHHQDANVPPSWRYFEIWMELRDDLRAGRI